MPHEPFILTARIHAGMNAEVVLGGLLALSGFTSTLATGLLRKLFPDAPAEAALNLTSTDVNGIGGWRATFDLPKEHHARTPADIERFYAASTLSPDARRIAARIWSEVSRAEAAVHGMDLSEVHFHEIGRRANIYAVGMIAELFVKAGVERFVVSPIPLADNEVECAHGTVPYPAPALAAMLPGVAVRPYGGTGEPVTPTGLAVLKGLGAEFGPWPRMTVEAQARAYARAVFEGTANGTLFCWGTALPPVEDEA